MRLTWLFLWVVLANPQSALALQNTESTKFSVLQVPPFQIKIVLTGKKNDFPLRVTLVENNVRKNNCLTAYDFSNTPRVTEDHILPCTLIDELFFIGIGQEMSQGAVEHGDQGISDYYPIYRKYLNLKNKKGRSSFDVGDPGLILLGMASAPTILDLQKKKLYEAYSLHQLSILHSKSIDQSGFSKDSVGALIDGFFLEKLSGIGVTTLGTLVCAVKFDIFDVPLSDILKTDAVQNCIDN